VAKGIKKVFKRMNNTSIEDRINNMIEVIMSVAKGNYTSQIECSDSNDELDSLSIGINMMINDLELDFNERRKIEEKLQRYKIILDNSSDIAFTIDTKGNLTFLNRAFEKLSGHKIDEFIGKTFAPLFDEQNLKKAMNIYSRTLNGDVLNIELPFKDTGFLIEYTTIPLKNNNEQIIGIIGVGRNITIRKNTEETLKKKMIELKNMNDLMVGRELRMIELKKEIEKLKRKIDLK
jgi:PAS domain S-box-containing protein